MNEDDGWLEAAYEERFEAGGACHCGQPGCDRCDEDYDDDMWDEVLLEDTGSTG